ncbi:hypothetical protein VKS41_001826 [Umbelopsis sp. WA50703]
MSTGPQFRTPLQRSNSSVNNFLSKTRQLGGSLRGARSNKNTTSNPIDHDLNDERQKPKNNSESFKRYELMIEFSNLRNPNHCPLGVYVMPSSDNLNVWFGVLFVHKGYYRSGVFKFRINIPESYPNAPPTVTFLTDMFHPLVDNQGRLSIAQQFPVWRPHQDYIFHILHYIKNAYKRVVLDGLVEKYCPNKEAYRLYRNDPQIFAKLAQQCAQLSITESYLFDHFPDNNMIKFSPLSEAKFDELKAQILTSTAHPPLSESNRDISSAESGQRDPF